MAKGFYSDNASLKIITLCILQGEIIPIVYRNLQRFVVRVPTADKLLLEPLSTFLTVNCKPLKKKWNLMFASRQMLTT